MMPAAAACDIMPAAAACVIMPAAAACDIMPAAAYDIMPERGAAAACGMDKKSQALQQPVVWTRRARHCGPMD